MVSEFTVTIDKFEGPLDLMLHLIKLKRLDLFNLDLSLLADQYIDYIRKMEDMHLEVASEYLTELAQLIEFKSKRLLPRDTSELEDNYEESTKERLVQRLLEYQRFKEVTGKFEELSYQRSLQFDKPESDIANFYRKTDDKISNDGTMAELLKAMNQCIKRYKILQPLPITITRKEISAEERIEELRDTINTLSDTFTLEELCYDCEDVYLVIITFLAVLDMIKNGELVASTNDHHIVIKRGLNYGTN